jgi:hypothetical protein
LDQINFRLPFDAPEGCAVTVQVRAGGRLSNLGTLTISPLGADECRHPFLTDSQIRSLDTGGTVAVGSFSLVKASSLITVPGLGSVETTTEGAGGAIYRFRADQMDSLPAGLTIATGSCYSWWRRGRAEEITPPPPVVALDAGPQLVLNGPNANNRAVPKQSGNVYNVLLYQSGVGGLGGAGSPTLTGGTYTLTGPGGADVRSFVASTQFPNGFTWTNRDSIVAIQRGQPLTVTWTGGGTEPGAIVVVAGASGARVGGPDTAPIYALGMFSCVAPAAAGSFTVPAAVTEVLPPASPFGPDRIGTLALVATNDGQQFGRFGAQLVAGGDAPGVFSYSWQVSKLLSVQ